MGWREIEPVLGYLHPPAYDSLAPHSYIPPRCPTNFIFLFLPNKHYKFPIYPQNRISKLDFFRSGNYSFPSLRIGAAFQICIRFARSIQEILLFVLL